jgi:hypothetical protein
MTTLLEKAFLRASKLPEKDQDALADLLLTEIESEARWQKAFGESADQLAELADEALKEFREGKTEPMDPDRL